MKTDILACGIGFLVTVISSGALGQISKAENKTFFQDTPKETKAFILPNLDPQSETSLAVNQNSSIVVVLSWWLNRILEPTYVPTVEFISQNVQLYPANGRHSEDIAALSFTAEGNRYQILQTGGLGGHFYVLVDTGEKTNADGNYAKKKVEGMINTMLKSNAQTKTTNISLAPTNGTFIGIGNFNGIPVQCLTNGKEICISVSKFPFQETLPAHEPLPGEWFSWERKKAAILGAAAEKARAGSQ